MNSERSLLGGAVEKLVASNSKPSFESLVLPKIEEFSFHVIRPEEERVNVDRLPSIPDSRFMPPDELVYLTHGAVKERLKTLLMTHPMFAEGGRVGAYEHGQFESLEGSLASIQPHVWSNSGTNLREAIPADQMIQIFLDAGYSFAQESDGTRVMLVDATIPASENSSGRMGSSPDTLAYDAGTQAESLTGVVPLDGVKVGIRPTSESTVDALAIPVEELVKLHQQKAPIEVRYARGNTEGAVNLDDVYSKLDYEGKRYFELYIRYLWSKEQQGGEAADFLVKFSELGFKQRNAEEAKEDRVELLKFLEQAGIELSVFSQSTGEFPYEPEVTFPYDPGKDEVESLAFRLTQGYDIDTVFHELTAKEQNTGFPATLRLQDFFLITRDRTSTFLWRDLQSGKEGQRLIVEDLERHM